MSYGKTTSGLNTISTSNVRQTKILVPDIKYQRRFLQILDRAKKMQKAWIDPISEDLFQSLNLLAFKGEI